MALPSLAAFLREQGVSVDLFDLDLESLEALLTTESLTRAAGAIAAGVGERRGSGEEAARLTTLAERLPRTAPEALATLRDPDRFFDPYALMSARETILDALDLQSAACPRPVHYGLEPLRYEVDGVDPTRFADLARVTADRQANLFGDFWENRLFPGLEADEFDLIGVSVGVRFQLIPALMLARELRARGHFVVLGGSYLQRYRDVLSKLPQFFELFADGVVAGDGETALLELVAQLRGRREFHRVPNFLYPAEGEVRFTRNHIEEVNRLPTPDFTGLPLDRYLSPRRVLPVLAGRGCYWGECKFCEIPHNHRVSSQPYRFRRPGQVVSDILSLVDRFDCRDVLFGDEALPPAALEAIADGIMGAGRTDLHFASYARFETGFTPALWRKLSEAGFRRVLFGLESGWQPTNDHMRKGVRISDVRPTLENLREARISFLLFALVGLPEETEESATATFSFFEENADLFDSPGNSFDIRPLELLWNSPYMKEAAGFGVRFDRDLVSGEFPVGAGRSWTNGGALSRDDVDRLFGDWMPRLGERLARSRSGVWPVPLWPAWDEWALLYAAHYRERPFPFRPMLPEGDGRAVRFRWNPALAVTREPEGVRLTSRRTSLVLDPRSFQALAGAGDGTPDMLVGRLSGGRREGDVRDLISLLVEARILDIVPASETADRENGRSRGTAPSRTS